jgi:hypothetical protein
VNGWHEEALLDPAVAAPKDWAAPYASGAFCLLTSAAIGSLIRK